MIPIRRLIALVGLVALGFLAGLVLARYRAGDLALALLAGQLPGCW